MKSNDVLPDSEEFILPSPSEPLRSRNADHFPLDDIVAAMEAVLKSVDLGPSFEADRLATKCHERFRM
jgi:hypothetical protein